MRDIIVMPLHDPAGQAFVHLAKITPVLKDLFAGIFIGVTAVTTAAQAD